MAEKMFSACAGYPTQEEGKQNAQHGGRTKNHIHCQDWWFFLCDFLDALPIISPFPHSTFSLSGLKQNLATVESYTHTQTPENVFSR